MAKTRTEIDKEMMYRKIMPSAAKKDTLGNAGDMHADGAVQAASAGMAREAEGAASGMSGAPGFGSLTPPTAASMAKALKRNPVTLPFKEENNMVLVNLMENAVIHGGTSRIDIALTQEGEDAVLTVSDNGSGIPPEVLERLNSHELIPGGHLGLNNVDRIVRLSYGESCGLSAYPNVGGGSCGQVRLPMKIGDDHAQGTDR